MENATKALKLIALARDKVSFTNIGYDDMELVSVIALLCEAIDLLAVK